MNINANKPESLQSIFYQTAAEHAKEVAVISNRHVLSYQEFNALTNKFGAYILKRTREKNPIVAVMLERSADMLISIYGLVKAGAAYLPINVEEPQKRKEFILEDSQVSMLITLSRYRNTFNFDGEIIYMDEVPWNEECDDNIEKFYDKDDLVYVIYTSGTTGNPKGVMIYHKGLLNRILWMQKDYPIRKQDIIMHKTPYTFDVSVWELFWWCFIGAKLSILEPGEHKNIKAITGGILRDHITVLHFVPSMFSVFLEYLELNKSIAKDLGGLKYIFCSGEELKKHQVGRFNRLFYEQGYKTKLINLYGPTEATIDVTHFDCTGAVLDKVPIGNPIDNIEIFILGKQNQLCEVGEVGELCISGVGLARGYLNRPDLNKEKFILLPSDIKKRIYKTGDLALKDEHGLITYMGRIDNQVKIHGNRIELGEIEKRILEMHGIVDAAAVVVAGRADTQYIQVFVVTKDESLSVEMIKKQLEKYLPDYMMPHSITNLDAMPVTINGKVDTKKLISLGSITNVKKSRSRQDQELTKLVEILSNSVNLLIPVQDITYTHNLEELGIESLSFLRIIIGIEAAFDIEVDMEDLDGASLHTIRDLIDFIKLNQNVTPVEGGSK